MKKFINKVILIAAFGLFFSQSIFAQINGTNTNVLGQDELNKRLNTITTSVPFLMIAPDARAGAMGDAGVSSTPDANSLHWNPSKYAFIEKEMGFSISYSPWLRKLVNDINLAYVSGYKKIGKNQAIAASLLYFSLGDITFTDVVGNTIGQFKPSEYAIDLCYSRKLADHFSGGISLRYIHSNLTGGIDLQGGQKSHAGNSFATDVSAYYNKEIEISKQKALFAFGVNISNIGAKISYTDDTKRDFIPINLRLGPSLSTNLDKYNSLGIVLDLNKLLVPTPPLYDTSGAIVAGKDPNVGIVGGMFGSFSDAPGGFTEELHEITYSVGLEYWYDKQFAVRAGYFYEHATKGNRKYFTVGAGLRYNVFGLNLAYLIPTEQHNPLENTLRFTLLFDFDAFKEQNKKTN